MSGDCKINLVPLASPTVEWHETQALSVTDTVSLKYAFIHASEETFGGAVVELELEPHPLNIKRVKSTPVPNRKFFFIIFSCNKIKISRIL